MRYPWVGPLASEHGEHLVRVTARAPGGLPALDEVRDRVRSEWLEDARVRQNRAALARVRAHYRVSIAWPADAR